MDEGHRLTVASTWRLDEDGVEFLRSNIKSIGVFSKYEVAHEVLVIDGCDIATTARILAESLGSFIEEENDNDLLEKPRITRIVPPNAVDVVEDAFEQDFEASGPLIDDVSCPAREASLPLAIKYWPETDSIGGASVDPFFKLSYNILAQLAQKTGVNIVLEKQHMRVRVSSSHPKAVEEVMGNLDNLSTSLACVSSPRVANLLNVGSSTEFRLQFAVYKSLNELAMPRILIDPESPIRSQLHAMFATTMTLYDEDTRKYSTPTNIAYPPQSAGSRKGRSKLWAGAEASKSGYASAAMSHPSKTVDTSLPQPAKVEEAQNRSPYIREAREAIMFRPYVSNEKANIIRQWATAIQADAPDFEPNTTAPSEPAPEIEQPPKGIAGLKKRRAVGVTANAAVAEATLVEAANDEMTRALAQKTERIAAAAVGPSSPPAAVRKSQPAPAPTPRGPSAMPLIDLWDGVPEPTLAKARPPQFESTVRNDMPPQLPTTARPRFRPSNYIDLLGDIPEEHRDHTMYGVLIPEKVQSNTKSINPGTQPSRRSEQESGPLEPVRTPVYRTMKQKAPRPQRQNLSKAENAKRQAAISSAWGEPGPSAHSGKPVSSAAPEPSKWKKEKLSAGEKIHIDMIKGILAQLEPVLEAARRFTGTLKLEVQLGMILLPMVPKQYTDRLLETKAWDEFFKPKNNMKPPSTAFVNRLTTSGADVDYILGLTTESNGVISKLFRPEPSSRSVQYELHCKAKNSEQIVVRAQENGEAIAIRPEAVIGAVNLHTPRQIWDLRVVVTGSQEYAYGLNQDVDTAVQSLIQNLSTEPKSPEFKVSSKCDQRELQVVDAFLRRSTTHLCVADAHSAGKQPHLRITEVQRLAITPDATGVSARALGDNTMLETARLWYEVSIVNPAIEELFRPNKSLELGSCTTDWLPMDIVEEKYRPANPSQQSSRPKVENAACLGRLYLLANQVVEKIDAVGWANAGIGIEPESGGLPSGSAFGRSSVYPINPIPIPCSVPQTPSGRPSQPMRPAEPVSGRDDASAAANEDDFW